MTSTRDGVAEPGRGEGVGSVRSPEEFRLDAVYFDTADLDLARRGVTLRRRSGGADAGWHLKLPVSGDTRTELHAPLGQAEETVPALVLTHVRAIVRDRLLAPSHRCARPDVSMRCVALTAPSLPGSATTVCGRSSWTTEPGAVVAGMGSRARRRRPRHCWTPWRRTCGCGSLTGAGVLEARTHHRRARTGHSGSALEDDLAAGTVGQLFVALLTEQTAKLQLRGRWRAGRTGRVDPSHADCRAPAPVRADQLRAAARACGDRSGASGAALAR